WHMSQSSISRFLNTATVASAATINQIKIITKFKPISTNPAPTSTSFANSTNCTLGKYVVKPNMGYFSIRISNNEPNPKINITGNIITDASITVLDTNPINVPSAK